jgi:hypothetical protein
MTVSDACNGTPSPVDFTLRFWVQPPSAIRPGFKFNLPVIVATGPTAGCNPVEPDPGEQLMLYASLRDESGSSIAGIGHGDLTGDLSDGLHSQEDDALKGYSKFDNLAIQRQGRFRIRVHLGVVGSSGTPGLVTRAYVDSHVIWVHPGADMVQRPSKLL